MTSSNHITEINALTLQMIEERKKANHLFGIKSAELYCEKVKPHFEKIRYHSDKLETMVDVEKFSIEVFNAIDDLKHTKDFRIAKNNKILVRVNEKNLILSYL